ncbi:hypothetical protein GRF29_1536g1289122 [Pseudopithomyces chartarum]|uniref:Uncharacterized protein n=1 Tax=Pseudopithomyces chartarum TaxID=1892770 RepID=A0AAN6RC82_9PLEO|nr:hypothetical protein GRF29_1536g1289122 [Pseudopithomyces chartarum]
MSTPHTPHTPPSTNPITLNKALLESLWGQLSLQHETLGINSSQLNSDNHIPENLTPTNARQTVRNMIERFGAHAMYSIWRWERKDGVWVATYTLHSRHVAGAEKDRKEREERSAKREREVEERNFREIQRAIEEEG